MSFFFSELSEMVKQHLVAVQCRHINLSRQLDAWKSLPQTEQNVKFTFHLTEQTHFYWKPQQKQHQRPASLNVTQAYAHRHSPSITTF